MTLPPCLAPATRPPLATALGAALLVLTALSTPATAAVFQVTKTPDTLDGACDADCSLREAVAASNLARGADVVMVPPGIYLLSRAGAGEDGNATGDLDAAGDLTVVGAGARETILDGGGLDRVLQADSFALELFGLTVRNGKVTGDGGGILSLAHFEMNHCVVSGNEATGRGGGLLATGSSLSVGGHGDVVIDASTIDGNRAGTDGGGMWLGGELVLTNSTVSGNHAEVGGGLALLESWATVSSVTVWGNSAAYAGGIVAGGGEDMPSGGGGGVPAGCGLRNSIVAGNSASHAPDCAGPIVSDGNNLIGNGTDCELWGDLGGTFIGTAQLPLDPLLGPLGYHGGPTPTHSLLPGSPAIDTGAGVVVGPSTIQCHPIDQNDRARPADGDGDGQARCDIGAVERTGTCENSEGALCLGDRFRVTARWLTPPTEGAAHALPATADTGYFWFFAPTNVEITVKVLDGCGLNDRYWVFVTGLTDAGVELTVDDTLTQARYVHRNEPGQVFQAKLDTGALASCH